MPNDMDFFDFLSQHSLEDVLSAIIQYQLENLMHDGEQLSLAEYAAANALYACPQNGISPLTRNAYINLKSILGSLPNDYALVLISEAIKRKESSNAEKASFLQSTSMKMKNTFFRGDGYLYQLLDCAKKLYGPLDTSFKSSLGFSFSSCYQLITYIFRETEFRYRAAYKNSHKIGTLIKSLFNRSDKSIFCIDSGYIFRFYKTNLYSVIPQDEINALLNYLCVKPFSKTFEKVGLSDFKCLTSKPFIDFGSYIYMPLLLPTLMNLPKLFHYTFIAESHFNDYEKGVYTTNRGQVVEDLTEAYFSRLTDSSNIYTSLKYSDNSGEADVTVCTNSATIFCECKSKILTLSSLNGNIDSIKKDVKQAIGNAFQQALRSIRYVEDGKEFLSSSSQKIKLKNTSSKYIVCVTAEHFGNVPSETTFYNLIDSQAHLRPYIVNIFDLDIITQECSSIEDFLSYLDFRAQYIDLFTSFDELDIFGYYKSNPEIPSDADCLVPLNYTSSFDRKYEAQNFAFKQSLL